jgi:hypothetical protein
VTAPRALLLIVLVFLPALAAAQEPAGEPAPPPEQPAGTDESDNGAEPEAEAADAPALDDAERVSAARRAFAQAEYGKLVELLEPLFPDAIATLEDDDRKDARQLFGVGLFFRAQQATAPTQRDALLDRTRSVFLDLLREDPFFQLDPLLYPASVVEVFDGVVADNTEELEELRASMRPDDGPQSIETVYIQREQERANFALVFFPFAVGQFQNGDLVKGTLLASVQAASLILNIASYLVVESLRNPRGYYCTGVDDAQTPLCEGEGDDFTTALTWRNVMYGSLVTFGIAYLVSVADAWVNFEEYDVNIRTLDGPPPELVDQPGSQGSELPIGFSLEFSW